MSEFITETNIPGLLLIERPTYYDERGLFREVVRKNELEEAIGHAFDPVQWNHSKSEPRVIRALHAESWNKLVYPVTGRLFAALVDIRPDSNAFGTVETVEFDSSEPKAMYVPDGVANSICVIGDAAVHYMYLVDKYYDGYDTRAVAWDDPDLVIDWPVANPVISERDRNNPTMREMFPDKYDQ